MRGIAELVASQVEESEETDVLSILDDKLNKIMTALGIGTEEVEEPKEDTEVEETKEDTEGVDE